MVTKKKSDSHRNRGLKFEHLIEHKCDELKKQKIAIIGKIPTDWKITRGAGGKIIGGFPVAESKFVDFCGLFKGKPISIEAKETKNKTSFPFSNIKDYQIKFLDLWTELGGLGYYIIRFVELQKVYFIPSKIMNNCIRTIGRKSAPISWFKDTKEVIELDYNKLNFEDYVE